MLTKDLMMKVFNSVQWTGMAVLRGCIDADGVFDAGQARNVKMHIDLMLKLHKMSNNAGHARTEDD